MLLRYFKPMTKQYSTIRLWKKLQQIVGYWTISTPQHAGMLLVVCLVVPFVSRAQSSLTWEELAQVTFIDEYQSQTGTVYPRAEFSKKIRQREGQDVFIIGYLLPLDVKGKFYALSASPFAACFFCGKSGPETVM